MGNGLTSGQRTRLIGCTGSISLHFSCGALMLINEDLTPGRQKSFKIISPINCRYLKRRSNCKGVETQPSSCFRLCYRLGFPENRL